MMAASTGRWGRTIMSGILGLGVGYAAISLLTAGAGDAFRALGLQALILAAVGLIYGLTGAIVGLGTLLPGAGARVLNVAGREDLVDQRAMLLGSAVACLAMAAALLMLALSGPQGVVSDAAALGTLGAAMVVVVAITWRQWRHYDELMRQLSWESAGIGLGLAFPLLTLWAALAHLGRAAPLDPLGLIAALAAALLLGAFMAAGRRGLLLPG